MFDGVVDRFLGDEVKMGRGEVVRERDGTGTVKRAGHLPLLPSAFGQVGQRGHQPFAIDRHGEQSPQDGPQLLLAAVQSLSHLRGDLRRFRRIGSQHLRQVPGLQVQGGQLLADRVVQIVADAPLFQGGGLDDLALQSLRRVMSRTMPVNSPRSSISLTASSTGKTLPSRCRAFDFPIGADHVFFPRFQVLCQIAAVLFPPGRGHDQVHALSDNFGGTVAEHPLGGADSPTG